jgi:hypothetical protein
MRHDRLHLAVERLPGLERDDALAGAVRLVEAGPVVERREAAPWLQSGRIVVRSDRPSSIVAPNRNITKVESAPAPPATSPSCGQQPLRNTACRQFTRIALMTP